MTTLTTAVRSSLTVNRRMLAAATYVLFGLANIFLFGLHSHGNATFSFALFGAKVGVPNLVVPAAPVCYALGVVCIAIGVLRAAMPLDRAANRVCIAGAVFCFVVALLCWADAGNSTALSVVNLLQGTLVYSIPLILGALAGVMCERSGVINIAIEGQLLIGAFAAAVITSAFGSLWLGLITGSLAGGLLGGVLAVFAIKFLVDQIILGVVLNVFASGLTGYLYDQILVPYQNRLNSVKAEAAPVTTWRRWLGPATFAVFGLVNIFVFGLLAHHGDVTFASSQPFARVTIPNFSLPAAETCFACGALTLVLAAVRAVVPLSTVWRRVTIGLVVFLFVLALMCWAGAGQTTTFNIVNLLQGTLSQSIPIMLGALTGVVCSRSGVVNIGIEGQLLLGAFIAAMVASASGSLWLGLIAGAAAGCVVGALLAVFAIRYTVDQIILGVVLNGLILGLTGYLYDDLMVPYANTLNSPPTFSAVKIPLLADIPIIGPVFFQATIFLDLTSLALALVQVGLFSTRWGLRTRAVGEHPVAADTVGIRVYATRYRNVILAGVLAGIGGHRRCLPDHRLGRELRQGHVLG